EPHQGFEERFARANRIRPDVRPHTDRDRTPATRVGPDPPHPAAGPRRTALPQRLRRGPQESRMGRGQRTRAGLLRSGSGVVWPHPLIRRRSRPIHSGGGPPHPPRTQQLRLPLVPRSTRSTRHAPGASLASLGGRPPPERIALRAPTDDGMDPHHAPPVCGKSASARPQGPLSSRSTNTTPTRPCIPQTRSTHLGTTSDPGECAGISDYAPSACRAPPVQRQGGAQRFEATCRPRRNENPRASGDAGAVRRDPPQTGPDRRTEGEAGRKEKRERRGGEERDGGKADVPRYLRYPRVGVSPKSAGAFHDTVSLCISGRAGDTCVLLVLGEV